MLKKGQAVKAVMGDVEVNFGEITRSEKEGETEIFYTNSVAVIHRVDDEYFVFLGKNNPQKITLY